MGMPNCCNTRFLVRLPFGHHSCGLPVPNAAFPITITAHDVAEKRGKRYRGCPHNLIKNSLVIRKMTKKSSKKRHKLSKMTNAAFSITNHDRGACPQKQFLGILGRYRPFLTIYGNFDRFFCRFGYFLAVLGHFWANDGKGKC